MTCPSVMVEDALEGVAGVFVIVTCIGVVVSQALEVVGAASTQD